MFVCFCLFACFFVFFCKFIHSYNLVEQESLEPFTERVEIHLDDCMQSCFLTSIPYSLHPWASVCIPSLSFLSRLLYFFFFFVSVPWLPCGHSVRWVCLSPLAICFPDTEENWSSVQTYIYTHISTLFFSTNTHALWCWRLQYEKLLYTYCYI